MNFANDIAVARSGIVSCTGVRDRCRQQAKSWRRDAEGLKRHRTSGDEPVRRDTTATVRQISRHDA